MRKISANYIFPVSGKTLKYGILVLDDRNKIVDLIDTGGNLRESAGLEYYNGILVPGFINSHCHLELSHLRGKVDKKKGLPAFLSDVVSLRTADKTEILKNAKTAHAEMTDNGIVAAGDICNTPYSFEFKTSDRIKYHSFLEVYGLDEKESDKVLQKAEELSLIIETKYPHPHSVSPHAPYTVPPALFSKLAHRSAAKCISIHMQESQAEIELFASKKGELFNSLSKHADMKNWDPGESNSLKYSLGYMKDADRILLVHNTYFREDDIKIALNHKEKIYLILCPNANIYIENRLPDIELLIRSGLPIAIGSDSLASNNKLSILEEIKTISMYYPGISLTELIKWACINGARALGFENKLGSFDIGKTPGVNLITRLDLHNLRLTKESIVKKLA